MNDELDRKIKKQKRNRVLFVMVVVVLTGAALAYRSLYSEREILIPYSTFKRYLVGGLIESVTLSPDKIRGALAEPDVELRGKKAFSTYRVDDPQLMEQLQAGSVEFSGQSREVLRPEVTLSLLPLFFMTLFWLVMMRRTASGAAMPKTGQARTRLLSDPSSQTVDFSHVAGIDEAKEELVEVIEFLKEPQKFEEIGGRIPRGVLLVGAPGTGKTLLAKAVAGEAGVPFFRISGSEFVEMFVGVGAARVRDLFRQAAAKNPCIVFIDELDALGKTRGSGSVPGHEEREQTLNQLLVEMDGFDGHKGVIIMAATNRPETLDPALLRPGRFDRQVVVDVPDLTGREAILRVHGASVRLDPGVELRVIASQTSGFVGADLANIVNEAALLAARRGRQFVGMTELEEAIERVVTGLKKRRLMNPRERRIVAYHEAGHALVGVVLPHADPVHKISIVPRGPASLGYTMQLPTEDRYLLSRCDLEDRLATLMGGRVAEERVFGDVTTGAQNDLQVATRIARAMVTQYGMSTRMGLASYEAAQATFLKGSDVPERDRRYSDKIAAEIDEEIGRILSEARQRADAVLEGHRSLLDALAERLLHQEVISKAELEHLLDEHAVGKPYDRRDRRSPGGK